MTNFPLWALIVSVGGGMLLVVVLVVMFVCCLKRFRKKSVIKIWNEIKNKTSVDVKAMRGRTCEEKIQPDLEDLCGIGLNLEGQDLGLGRLHYSIDYDYQSNDLIVSVLQCSDLPLSAAGKTIDSFVKCHLLPHSKTYETQVVEKSLNPIYDQHFLINISIPELQQSTLIFNVYNLDAFTKQEQIGRVSLSLEYVDGSNVLEQCSYIQPPCASEDECITGELCLTLRYSPTIGNLTLTVLEAKELKVPSSNKVAADPYVKISLMCDSKLVNKKKTSIKKRSSNPYYNESFTMSLSQNQIKNTSLILTAMDHNLFGKSVVIGHVTLGYDTSGPTLKHWSEMMASPKKHVTHWHCLIASENEKNK